MRVIDICLMMWCGFSGAIEPQSAGQMVCRDEQGEPRVFALEWTRVDMQVTGQMVYASVEQAFRNPLSVPIEATYTFPMPEDATLCDMVLHTSISTVRSVVQEKARAQETFAAARTQGKTAALVESKPQQTFTTSVTQIPPGESVRVCLSYVEPLAFEDQAYEIRFPTTFGPRYVPQVPDLAPTVSHDLPLDSNMGVSDRLPCFFAFSVEVRGLPVRDIVSVTHDITVEEVELGVFRAELANGMDLPNRDLQLGIQLWADDQPQARVLQTQTARGVHGVLTVHPPQETAGFQDQPLDVIFLVDTSGSMEGVALHQAKKAVEACLELMLPHDALAVLQFSGRVIAMDRELRPFTPLCRQRAVEFVQGFEAGGGTEMARALTEAFALRTRPEALPVVLFLTDGDVQNKEALVDLVAHQVGRKRLFCMGLGSAPNAYLLKALSEKGRGFPRMIEATETLAEDVFAVFDSICAPVMTDLQLDFQDAPSQDLILFPEQLPDVFQGRPVQLLFYCPQRLEGNLVLRGKMDGQPVAFPLELESATADIPGLERMVGQAWVDALMAQWYRLPASGERDRMKTDIVDAALSYQLVTPFTSRVAVEQVRTAATGMNPQRVQVPLMTKANFPATATHDPVRLLTGAVCLLSSLILMWYQRRRWRASVARRGDRR